MPLHTHVVAKSRGGRTPAHARCVGCRYTTNRKQFVQCPLGDCTGGRLCLPCHSVLPPNTPANCKEWHRVLSSERSCGHCLKPTRDRVNCSICELQVCMTCCVPESLDLFAATGKEDIICKPCTPPRALVRPQGKPRYCILCCSEHPGDGSTPKCLDPDFPGTPLANHLRAGFAFNASLANTSESFGSSDDVSFLSESLPPTSPPSRAPSQAASRAASAVPSQGPSAFFAAHPSLAAAASASAFRNTNNPLPLPENFDLGDPTFQRSFESSTPLRPQPQRNHQIPARPNPSAPTENINFAIQHHGNIDEAKVSAMIAQSLLPVSLQMSTAIAGIKALETSLQRFDTTSRQRSRIDIPDPFTIQTQTSETDIEQAKLHFDGKLEPLSIQAFDNGIDRLADRMSSMLGRVVKSTQNLAPSVTASANNQNSKNVKKCRTCGSSFTALKPFHSLCKKCVSSSRDPRQQRQQFTARPLY